ncbi:MAG: hypothetical protein MAG451_00790 [Anaerolineales bacterium]|nr:hypothetical protein [Anaerolineales bacterium]
MSLYPYQQQVRKLSLGGQRQRRPEFRKQRSTLGYEFRRSASSSPPGELKPLNSHRECRKS